MAVFRVMRGKGQAQAGAKSAGREVLEGQFAAMTAGDAGGDGEAEAVAGLVMAAAHAGLGRAPQQVGRHARAGCPRR
jgi:hypothetical protein